MTAAPISGSDASAKGVAAKPNTVAAVSISPRVRTGPRRTRAAVEGTRSCQSRDDCGSPPSRSPGHLWAHPVLPKVSTSRVRSATRIAGSAVLCDLQASAQGAVRLIRPLVGVYPAVSNRAMHATWGFLVASAIRSRSSEVALASSGLTIKAGRAEPRIRGIGPRIPR